MAQPSAGLVPRGAQALSSLTSDTVVMRQPNAQYNVARPGSLPERIATFQRRRMYRRFLERCAPRPEETLLDVGATSDETYAASNYLEAWTPHPQRITAVGLDDAGFLEQRYPGLRFVRADGRELPFADGSFDVVHSSAVIEHVGGVDQQTRFLAELYRVARRAVFVTTPNRWFPVEFHTVLPLLHWLPKPAFRRLLLLAGKPFFADERNLDLLTAAELRRLCGRIGARGWRVEYQTLAGWPANILLSVDKTG